MTAGAGYLRLNCLRILQRVHVAYEEEFHEGVNIIRGQNGSGKSTIADFIFFILGGEFDDWKDAAGHCDEVQAEIETPRGKLTLRRRVAKSQEAILVYFGSIADALESAIEGWERFPIRRQGNRESFSQVMFRSLQIPEARSEGAANITMHQLLRSCCACVTPTSARRRRVCSVLNSSTRIASARQLVTSSAGLATMISTRLVWNFANRSGNWRKSWCGSVLCRARCLATKH